MTPFKNLVDTQLAAAVALSRGVPPQPAVASDPKREDDLGRVAELELVCPGEFRRPIDRSARVSPDAFDQVSRWDGRYPGPLAAGATRTAKTRAAWVALRRLYVSWEIQQFRWYPVSDLLQRYQASRESGNGRYFLKGGSRVSPLFIDDVDKINWAFESEISNLFAIYDAIYRENIPCIATTNQTRAWWTLKMGDAFARRLFDDAHTLVQF